MKLRNGKIINKKKVFQDVFVDDLKIGDQVFITFCPDSQKYIDLLQPVEGIVSKIGQNFQDLMLKDEKGNEFYAAYDSLHFFGMSLGYSWWINKIVES